MEIEEPGANDVMVEVGRHWGWALAFGVLTLILGIVVVAWPHIPLLLAAFVFGLQLIISAVFRFISAFAAPAASGWARVLSVIIAILSLIAGIYLIRHPVLGVVLLAVVLGIYWIATGALDLFLAIGYRELPRRWVVALMGGLGILAGIIVVSNPVSSLAFLVWVLGIWLVVFGVMTILSSFVLMRRSRNPMPRAAATT